MAEGMTFTCPSCEQLLEVPPEMAGSVVACPTCGQELAIPEIEAEPVVEDVVVKEPPAPEPKQEETKAPGPSPSRPGQGAKAADAGDEGEGKKCPSCGAVMEPDAVLCLQCGFHTELGTKLSTDFS